MNLSVKTNHLSDLPPISMLIANPSCHLVQAFVMFDHSLCCWFRQDSELGVACG